MKFKKVGRFQEGGAVPPQQGGDPMQEILAACQQAVETQDCQIALQVCQVLLEMTSGAPAEAAPAPAPAPAEPVAEPVYRKGGILARRIR